MLISEILVQRFVLFSRIASVVIAILCLVVLSGWATANYSLTRLIPDCGGTLPFVGQIHSAAAINLLLLSVALLLASFHNNLLLKKISLAISILVVVASLVACTENITGAVYENLRVLAPTDYASGITYPTPMILEVSLTVLFLGLASALLYFESNRSATPAQIAALVSTPIPIIILFGAATKSPKLCALGGCFEMSLAFALITLSYASALFFVKTEDGMARLFVSTTRGGGMCRRAIMVLAFIPALLILRTMAVNYKVGDQVLVEEPLSWALFGLVLVAVVAYMVISGAKSLEVLESEREEIVDKLIQTEQALSNSYRASIGPNSEGGMRFRYKKVCMICTQEYDDSLQECPLDGGPLDRIIDDSLEGTTFADKYQVECKLGEGGMSSVYKAKHIELEKYFAIKVLKGATGSGSLKRFKREAQATSSLSHKNIVGVNDFGISSDGRSYIVMEYVEGESLSDLIKRMGPLSQKVASYLIMQICDGLIVAHGQGIVHRDLKPANIMLVKNEAGGITAKIVDFGLAKILDDGQDKSQQLTQTGECFGSPLYMSPEQCLGKEVDHRADIYALGCIAYECLVGQPPIVGKTILETFNKHLNEAPQPFPQGIVVPQLWAAMIFNSLAKKVDHRPQSVSEFKHAFKVVSGQRAT